MPDIRVARYDSPDAQALIAELDADLDERYGEGDPVLADPGEFVAPDGRFLVAYEGDRPVACAGIRRLDADTAELKRMFVRPVARGKGVAKALLAACEAAARDLGYSRLWLETGIAQPEAMTLYTSSGYTPVRRFGQYAYAPSTRYLGIDL